MQNHGALEMVGPRSSEMAPGRSGVGEFCLFKGRGRCRDTRE